MSAQQLRHVVGLPDIDPKRTWVEMSRVGGVVLLARIRETEWVLAVPERNVVPVHDTFRVSRLVSDIYVALAGTDNESVGCALDALLDYALPIMAQPSCPLDLRIIVATMWDECRGRTWRA